MKKLMLFVLLSLGMMTNASAGGGYIENPNNADFKKPAAPAYPNFSMNFWGQLQYDSVISSDIKNRNKVNDVYWTLFPDFTLQLSPKWAIKTTITLEPNSTNPTEDRLFNDHGLYVDELLLTYRDGDAYLYGGFMVPKFARAWEAPGVFSMDLSEQYPMYDRLIVGGEYTYDLKEGGQHTVGSYAFAANTTIFSNSTLQERGRKHSSDGGLSNTGGLDSYAFTLEGENMKMLPGVGYFAHYARQEASDKEQSDESRFALGLTHNAKLTDTISAETLLEFVRLDDAAGNEGHRHEFETAVIKFTRGKWNSVVGYTMLEKAQGGITRNEEEAFQISFGREIGNGLSADLGWKILDQDGKDEQVVGLVFTYAKDFE